MQVMMGQGIMPRAHHPIAGKLTDDGIGAAAREHPRHRCTDRRGDARARRLCRPLLRDRRGERGMTTRLAAAAIAACLAATAAAQAPGRWQMVWSDEFDGTAVDRSKWSFADDCWGGGNKERQCYVDRPANAAVADGILTITARAGETTGPAIPSDQAKPGVAVPVQTKPFNSAKLLTKGKAAWTYGRFRIRARLPHGQGTWPAIWMLPDHNRYGPWAASGEIDIMEVVNLGARCPECPGGIEDRLLGTLHFGGPPPANRLKGDEVRDFRRSSTAPSMSTSSSGPQSGWSGPSTASASPSGSERMAFDRFGGPAGAVRPALSPDPQPRRRRRAARRPRPQDGRSEAPYRRASRSIDVRVWQCAAERR